MLFATLNNQRMSQCYSEWIVYYSKFKKGATGSLNPVAPFYKSSTEAETTSWMSYSAI